MTTEQQQRFIDAVSRRFADCGDYANEARQSPRGPLQLLYLNSIVDPASLSETIEAYLSGAAEDKDVSVSDAVDALLSGKMILAERSGIAILSPSARRLQRTVGTPQSETSLLGAADAFTEALNANVGLLRIHARSPDLVVRQLETGTRRKRTVAICFLRYTEDSEAIAREIERELNEPGGLEIEHLQSLTARLRQRSWSPVPPCLSTEQPEQAAALLLEGRVVLLVDQLPFAVVVPSLVTDMWNIYSDRNYAKSVMIAVRGMRILGIMVTLLAPGLYVALVSVNPELFRIDIALSVAKSREGVPYPAIVEMLMMLIVSEMIVAASVRLPKSIGPTITMVGGIILGQAAVQAELVSNLLLIVLSATIIANFTVVGLQHAYMLRLFKYGGVLLGSIYGVMGLISGLAWLLLYFGGIHSFQVPYLGLRPRREERI
ncbi:spore germination protein [Paenibacillus sp.]|uniref:spore germination protein n=1 Tax=Paenibacillus sp. TaxID=58172 RepID=UPI0028122947|nr:spore germination protein [Paenibacillus sp.]